MVSRPLPTCQYLRLFSSRYRIPWTVSRDMETRRSFARGCLSFDLSEILPSDGVLRSGKLSLPNRATVDTPHYFAVSSRGCVPHITQDMARKNTGIKGIYVALEDCECLLFCTNRTVPCSGLMNVCLGVSKSLRRPLIKICRSTTCPLLMASSVSDNSSHYNRMLCLY